MSSKGGRKRSRTTTKTSRRTRTLVGPPTSKRPRAGATAVASTPAATTSTSTSTTDDAHVHVHVHENGHGTSTTARAASPAEEMFNCTDGERLDQERLLLTARIHAFDHPTTQVGGAAANRKALPAEYTTPARGEVHCLHCGSAIHGVPVPMVFSLDASRLPPVYQVAHFFCDGPCSLAYLLHAHNADPHMIACTKQYLHDVCGIDRLDLLPAPPRFALQKYQRRKCSGISAELFPVLKGRGITSGSVMPLLQNYNQGFAVYSADMEPSVRARLAHARSSSTTPATATDTGTDTMTARATAALYDGRPAARTDPLHTPSQNHGMPPVLLEAYDAAQQEGPAT